MRDVRSIYKITRKPIAFSVSAAGDDGPKARPPCVCVA